MAAQSNSLLVSLTSLVKRYEDVIVKDPSVASKIESMLKVISYIIPGRFGGGYQLSEFAYCVSNLYALLNDYIIAKNCPASSLINKLSFSHRRLLWLLALLENSEVFIELCGESMYREVGKWLIVLIMRLLKATIQSIVVFRYKSRIITSPAVPTVSRKKGQRPQEITQPLEGQSIAYRGSRTGKVIRSIHGDPGIPYSELSQFINDGSTNHNRGMANANVIELTSQQLVAEALHIARPLVHIFSMVIFQQSSWKPWLISLTMDVVSLHLHKGLITFKTSPEPSEILRRRLVLLLYLMRSPFYDKYIKELLVVFLAYIANHVPLTSWITIPLMEYIPLWQGIYSYNWMS